MGLIDIYSVKFIFKKDK